MLSRGNTGIVGPRLCVVLLGIGSKVCSRKSKMCGLIIVSSGMLCKVIQAKRQAFFMPDFLRIGGGLNRGLSVDIRGDIDSSVIVLDS